MSIYTTFDMNDGEDLLISASFFKILLDLRSSRVIQTF